MKPICALTIVAMSASSAVAEDMHFKTTTQAATNVALRGYWRADKNCEPREPPPALLLDKPPEHGTVCFRRDVVKMQNVVVGEGLQHCIGRQIRGLKVVYRSKAGYSGPDEVRYTVVFPKAKQTVLVDVTVQPGEFRSNDNPVAPPDDPLQSAGPMPECAALVS